MPKEFPLKSLTLLPGAGREPPVWRSTIWPYQLPLMSLFEKSEDHQYSGPAPAYQNQLPLMECW